MAQFVGRSVTTLRRELSEHVHERKFDHRFLRNLSSDDYRSVRIFFPLSLPIHRSNLLTIVVVIDLLVGCRLY